MKKNSESTLGENISLELSVPWEEIKRGYQKALQHEAGNLTLKGFRKGKAPLTICEGVLGKEKIYDHALNHLLPHYYDEAIKAKNLDPLVHPQITPKKTDEGNAWVFEVQTAVAPEVKLPDYKKLIKLAAKKHREQESVKKAGKEDDSLLLQAIYSALVSEIAVLIAPLLLQEEMSEQVRRLSKELGEHHVTLADYIKSQDKTEDQFRDELAAISLGALKLEFILQAITKDLKLVLKENELKDWLATQGVGDMNKLPLNLLSRLELSLLKEKTVQAILDMSRTP